MNVQIFFKKIPYISLKSVLKSKREDLKTMNELPFQEVLLPLEPEKRDGNQHSQAQSVHHISIFKRHQKAINSPEQLQSKLSQKWNSRHHLPLARTLHMSDRARLVLFHCAIIKVQRAKVQSLSFKIKKINLNVKENSF